MNLSLRGRFDITQGELYIVATNIAADHFIYFIYLYMKPSH